MRLIDIKGRERFRNVNDRIVKWAGKSRSILQRRVKNCLFSHWTSHIVYEEFPCYGTKLTLDFYNANKRIAIEVQGKQHTGFIKYFHKNTGDYLHQLKKDFTKRKFCELNNITLIEIFEHEMDISDKELEEKLKKLGAF